MASTYSALKIELLETGANSGTWGTATNVNLGDAILGEAITGSATVDFASNADVTITLTDVSTTQAARNLRLNITESGGGVGSVRNLILGSGCQIEKFYLINNTGSGAKTVKNTSGTGITVPAGKATLVYNDGTNVVDAASYFTSLTLGSALPIASGGTGTTSTTFANLTTNVTGTLPIVNGGTGTTSTTFANLTTNVTGTLPVANGGTGITTTTAYGVVFAGTTATGPFQAAAGPGTATHVLTSNGTGALPTFQAPAGAGNLTGAVTSVGLATSLGSFTSAQLLAALTDETGTGSNVFATSPTLVTPLLGTPTSGVATNLTGLPLTTGVTGTLPVANGGTSLATLTANNVVIGNGTSAPLFVAPSTSGNVLTSNGTTWASTAPAASGALAAKTCTFNSSGTWTKPSGYGTTARVLIQAWGGGGSGALSCFGGAGGGGGGGHNYRWISIACLAATETVTIGAGGAARVSVTSGAVGGNTTFGSHITAFGGGGGVQCGVNSGWGGGGGGQLSAANSYIPGAPIDEFPFYVAAATRWVIFEGAGAVYSGSGPAWVKATAGFYKGGGAGGSSCTSSIRNGAKSVWGGGGGGGARSTCGAGTGGTSSFGGAGGAATQCGSAVTGVQPAGGGGAGSQAATSSGAGGAGRIVVTVYAGV